MITPTPVASTQPPIVIGVVPVIALMAAVLIAGLVSLDGESNWLEGAMLLAIYAIIALAFFWLPT